MLKIHLYLHSKLTVSVSTMDGKSYRISKSIQLLQKLLNYIVVSNMSTTILLLFSSRSSHFISSFLYYKLQLCLHECCDACILEQILKTPKQARYLSLGKTDVSALKSQTQSCYSCRLKCIKTFFVDVRMRISYHMIEPGIY